MAAAAMGARVTAVFKTVQELLDTAAVRGGAVSRR